MNCYAYLIKHAVEDPDKSIALGAAGLGAVGVPTSLRLRQLVTGPGPEGIIEASKLHAMGGEHRMPAAAKYIAQAGETARQPVLGRPLGERMEYLYQVMNRSKPEPGRTKHYMAYAGPESDTVRQAMAEAVQWGAEGQAKRVLQTVLAQHDPDIPTEWARPQTLEKYKSSLDKKKLDEFIKAFTEIKKTKLEEAAAAAKAAGTEMDRAQALRSAIDDAFRVSNAGLDWQDPRFLDPILRHYKPGEFLDAYEIHRQSGKGMEEAMLAATEEYPHWQKGISGITHELAKRYAGIIRKYRGRFNAALAAALGTLALGGGYAAYRHAQE